MSQDYTSVSKRRRARKNNSRPVLVTNTLDTTTAQTDGLTSTETLVAEPEPVAETTTTDATAETTRRSPRLPRFFSKVEKNETEDTTSDEAVVQARLSRARRGNKQAATVAAESSEVAEEPKKVSKPASSTPQRPPSMFKTRHIIGFAVYLFAAEFALPYERTLSLALHWDSATRPLTTLNLGSLSIPIYAWTLLNIITLVGLLYLLSRFDFLPNSKQLAAQRAAQAGNRSNSSNQNTPTEKVVPPTIRQGVQGEDDDLYQNYRLNQRRDKKR